MLSRQLSFACVTTASIVLSGCAAFYRIENVPTQHIVFVKSTGRLADPTGSIFCNDTPNKKNDKVAMPVQTWTPCDGRFSGFHLRDLDRPGQLQGDPYLNDLFKHMDEYYEKQGTKTRRIVLIIHGGLNSNKSTILRARQMADRIMKDGLYPIFINWQSSLPGSLAEHYLFVRQGNRRKGFTMLLAPAFLAGDLGRGAGRAAAIWTSGFANDRDRWQQAFTEIEVDPTYDELRSEFLKCPHPECQTISISRGEQSVSTGSHVKAIGRYAATAMTPIRAWASVLGRQAAGPVWWLPTQMIASPILDGVGTSAWDTMQRHAVLGFHTDGVPKGEDDLEPRPEGTGGISRFLTRLQKRMKDTSCSTAQEGCIDWELTLIGHSMGAIVVNHALVNFPDLDVDNIVYLAAACSVRDYEESVFRFMRDHERTRTFHVTLHPYAEINDQYFGGLPPSGSLLVWIDRFLAKPETTRDRTVGRFKNLMRFAKETPEDLRSRVHIKAFPFEHDRLPQHHGGFLFAPPDAEAEEKFWLEAFWMPEGPAAATPPPQHPAHQRSH